MDCCPLAPRLLGQWLMLRRSFEQRRRSLGSRGFTLFETLVAMALSALVLAVALPSLSTLVNAHQLQSGLRSTTGYIRLVRAMAVARNLQSRLVVSADGSTLTTEVLFGGTWTTAGSPLPLNDPITVTSVSPPPGLVFTPQGTTNAATTLTLQTIRGDVHTITVSLLGSVEIT